ncbi:MAG: ribbon-helix-helix protein, CopG family [Pyrinomonadaceae bacterium]
MGEIVRFGVSIEQDLLKNYDCLIAERGYATRSEALRDLIRESLIQRKSCAFRRQIFFRKPFFVECNISLTFRFGAKEYLLPKRKREYNLEYERSFISGRLLWLASDKRAVDSGKEIFRN